VADGNRVYPYVNKNGGTETNTYIVAFEEATQDLDYQDVVLKVENVRPAAYTKIIGSQAKHDEEG
jgi:hypothetical protein